MPRFEARTASERPADLHRQVLAARLTLCLVAVVAAGFLPDTPPGRRQLLAWLVPLVFVPFDSLLFMMARRGALGAANVVGITGELLVVFASVVLLPQFADAALIAFVFLVSVYAYLGGRRFGFAAAVGAIALTAGAQAIHGPATDITGLSFAMFAVVAVVMVELMERATVVQRRAVAELDRLRTKGDAILDRVADGVVVTDRLGRIDQLNGAASRMFGCDADTALGRRCQDVLSLHVGTRSLDCSAGCALLASEVAGDAHLGVEVWRTGAEGQRQPLLANVSAITAPDGRLREIVHSLRDVTRLKQAEEAKTLFLATASHELRTPLTVIQGFAQTLQHNPELGEGDRGQALAAIERRAIELARIVDRILLSSRIEAGRLELGTRPVDLGPMLTRRVDDLAAATGRHIAVEVPGTLPLAMADVDAVATVIDHLLDNALKYSPADDGVVVTASADLGRVTFTVRDFGIGMDAEQTAHCFEKFWQADSSNTRRFGGTGIGLYIVRSLVEAMAGTVSAASAEGPGAAFVVSLPAAGPVRARPNEADSVIREVIRQAGVAAGPAR